MTIQTLILKRTAKLILNHIIHRTVIILINYLKKCLKLIEKIFVLVSFTSQLFLDYYRLLFFEVLIVRTSSIA